MKIPNADKAVVDIAKLPRLLPSAEHLRGRHKARVFAASLGLTADNADELQAALLRAVIAEEAMATDQDEYGQRYVVDFTMNGPGRDVRIRSSWIVRAGEDYPRLTSRYVI